MKDGRFTIVIEDRHGAPVQEVSLDSGERVVGRFRECDIILPSENVSRRHARLVVEHDALFVEDMGSANGTFVNGERIRERVALGDGAVVRIGDFTLRVKAPGGIGARRVAYPRLIGRNLSVADQVFEVNRPTLVVGRGRDAGITLPDPSVSRVHARLICQPDGHLLVEDMGSANGTYVNNQRVRIWQLAEGDLLRFGNVELLVEIPSADTVDDLKPPSWLARAWLAFRENLVWGIASVVMLVALVVVVVLVVGSRPGLDEPGPGVVPTQGHAAPQPAPSGGPSETPSPDPLKEVMNLFARRDLDGAARVVDEVLRSRPADPEAVKMKNRIAVERRARETLQAALLVKDPVGAAASLLDIPSDSIFSDDARGRLKTLLPHLERRKDRACRARKVADCARLRGLVGRAEAYLVGPSGSGGGDPKRGGSGD